MQLEALLYLHDFTITVIALRDIIMIIVMTLIILFFNYLVCALTLTVINITHSDLPFFSLQTFLTTTKHSNLLFRFRIESALKL